METKKLIIGGVVLVVVAVGGTALLAMFGGGASSGKYDEFATCLGEKGATFYGAFWCPHCQDQKAMFGNSKTKLPYVECSLPSGKGQTPICIEKKIESYPTWFFADGSSVAQVMEFSALAEKTGCTLPAESAS